MAKSKNTPSFWGELLSLNLHKRNQGRLTRQLTALALALVVVLGSWSLSQGPLSVYSNSLIRVGIPFSVSVIGAWIAFRLVNYPRFADFLISVEAEIDKVSWASTQELIRATTVVLSTMFLLGAVLFLYDLLWRYFFQMIDFLII